MVHLREQLSNFSPLLFEGVLDQKPETLGPARPVTSDPAVRTQLVHRNHVLQPDELDELLAAYQSGTSIKALGRQLNLHEQTVRAHLVRAGVQLRPQKVLTPDQVAEITAGYQAGASLRELAAVHGVSDGSIRNYLLRTGVELRPARRLPRQAASDSP